MNIVRVLMTLGLAVGFAVFAFFLVDNADTKDPTEWERWVYVFGAVEALAFTAVGWLFGREVHRERAENAEHRADEAEGEKDQATSTGSKLAGMVVAAAEPAGAGGRERLEPLGPAGAQAAGLQAAREFARKHYDV
jgi:hypothetical protein